MALIAQRRLHFLKLGPQPRSAGLWGRCFTLSVMRGPCKGHRMFHLLGDCLYIPVASQTGLHFLQLGPWPRPVGECSVPPVRRVPCRLIPHTHKANQASPAEMVPGYVQSAAWCEDLFRGKTMPEVFFAAQSSVRILGNVFELVIAVGVASHTFS